MTEANTKSGKFQEKSTDPGFLVAKGKFSGETEEERRNAEITHAKKLASAIFMAMSNHGYAKIRAVGRNASYSAIKAIIIASGYCTPKGIHLVWEACFNEGNLGVLREKNHVSTVTAILFTLHDHKEWLKDKETSDGKSD